MMKLLLFFFLNLISSQVFAAACCGGGSALPSLITTDDRSQFISSLSLGEVVVDSVNGAGYWFRNNQHQQVQTLKFDYAYVLDSDIQFGVTIPIVSKKFVDQSYSGLSDIQMNVGYEYLPELEYNLLKPKGFVYSGLIFPTGQSQYTSQHSGLDSRGKQLWGLTLGHVLTKTVFNYDFIQIIDLHHYFDQSITSPTSDSVKVHHGLGGQFNIGAGYNWSKELLGFQMGWVYEDRISVKNQLINDSGFVEKYGQVSINYAYMLTDVTGFSVGYTDQTLLGSPENTSLSKTLSFQYTQRWTR